jgi:hypothetical protein
MIEQIGRYRIVRELGSGGFGHVYLAYDPLMDRQVAVKVLNELDDPTQIARFRTEAIAAGHLHHRNIITVHDFGEDQQRHYLVMEFLEGRDLHRTIRAREQMPMWQKVDIMAQLAEGLQCAHQSGVIHRDIKPANVLVLLDGTVKILDFGIARLTERNTTGVTKTGYLVGTLRYMAPEQLNGGVVDALSDIWSYGVIYHEILTGHHPFEAESTAAVMYRITNHEPDRVSAFAPDCPEALNRIVARLLAKRRESRYQSLAEVQYEAVPVVRELKHQHAMGLMMQAASLAENGRNEEAQRTIRTILDLDPGNAAAIRLQGKLAQSLKRQAAGLVPREESDTVEMEPPAPTSPTFNNVPETVPPARHGVGNAGPHSGAGSVDQDLLATQTIRGERPTQGRKLFSWKSLAAISAATILGAVIFAPPLLHKRNVISPKPVPVSIEIRTDPPAASVRIGDRPCVTPNCRMIVPPGTYNVVAQMPGYEPAQRTLIVEADKQPLPLDIALQPAPPPLDVKQNPTKIGHLVVQVGLTDVLVLIDNTPTARTGANGVARLTVEAKQHTIRVEKAGYRPEPEQQITLANNATHTARFTLTPERARLVFLAAPPGVEVWLGGILLGRTDGSAEYIFAETVPAGVQVLQATFQSTTQVISERFEAGQTLRVDWRSIGPPAKSPATLPKSEPSETTEEKAWDDIRRSSDPFKLQAFVDKYPNGPHQTEALLRLDNLVWARTNKDDISSLQTYMRAFPSGRYLRDASGRMDDLVWSRVNKASVDELKRFIADNPASSHSADAQALVTRMAAAAPASPQRQPDPAEVDKRNILTSLTLLEKAYQNRDAALVKSIYPQVDARIGQSFSAMREFHYSLQPQEPVVDGDKATVRCVRSVRAVPAKGRAEPSADDNVIITLRRSRGQWLIGTIERIGNP